MTDSVRSSTPSVRKIRARMLEPRVLLDAAAVETAVAVAMDAAPEPVPTVDTSALFDSPVTAPRREAYVIDSSVQGYESLLGQVPAGAELFVIQSDQPGLEQLNSALAAAGGNFDAIHIVSHGTQATVQLGADTLSSGTLGNFQAALQTLGSQLTAEGDILLYGCDVTSTSEGAAFIDSLASLTGADVAASSDATGGPAGDAVLENQVGIVSADSWSAVSVLDAPLALELFNNTTGMYEDGDIPNADLQLGYAMDASGDWAVSGSLEGEVRVWHVVGQDRTEQVITAPGGASPGSAEFGRAVAIDADAKVMVVGDPLADTAGRLFVYRLNDATQIWELAQTLDIDSIIGWPANNRIGKWSDATYGANQWLAVSGGHIVVGAPNEDTTGTDSGRIGWFASNDNWLTVANRGSIDGTTASAAFGSSVAISQNVIAVSAPGTSSGTGTVFLHRWDAGVTTAPVASAFDSVTGAASERFGAAIDLDYSNDPANPTQYRYTLVVGTPGAGTNVGEINIYQTAVNPSTFDGSFIGSATTITAQTNGGAADLYGLAVAVDSGRIIVGAPNHNATTDAGVFYYQVKNNSWDAVSQANPGIITGVETYKTWTAGSYGGAGDDRFGSAVALTGSGMVVAGAPQLNSPASVSNSGGVVFMDEDLTPSVVKGDLSSSDNLGVATDGSGNWVVSGGDGEVRVWQVIGDSRTEQVLSLPTGATATSFGNGIAIDGNTLVVGDPDAADAGRVFVYMRNTSTNLWELKASLDINAISGWDGGFLNPGERIGKWSDGTYSSTQWITVSGSHIVVGAPSEGSVTQSGRIAWYAATSADWSTYARGLIEEPNGSDANFGGSVALAKDMLAVSAPDRDTGSDGWVYLYTWNATSTSGPGSLFQTLEGGNEAANGARFGSAIDLEYYSHTGNAADGRYTLVIGAPGEATGEVYIYQSGLNPASSGFDGSTMGNKLNIHSQTSDDSYGRAVAVNSGRILVGAPSHDNAADSAVFYYQTTNNVWTSGDTSSPATHTGISVVRSWTSNAFGGAAADFFGGSVAFGGGGALAIGAQNHESNRGAVVFLSNPEITPTVSAAGVDQLGFVVDSSGEWVVAGGNGGGEVQVWRVQGTDRDEQRILRPVGSSLSFGAAVSIEGDTFVVGDPNAGVAGKVFVYRLNADTKQWALLKSVDIASDVPGWGTARIGAWTAPNYGGNQWIAVSGSHIVVGAPNEGGGTGRIAWFADTSTNSDWSTLNAGLVDEPPISTDPGGGDRTAHFGASVALAGDALVVGAPTADLTQAGGYADDSGANHGIVLVYSWNKTSTSAPVAGAHNVSDVAIKLSGSAYAVGSGAFTGTPTADGRYGVAVDVEYFDINPSPTVQDYRYTFVVGATGMDGNDGRVYVFQTSENNLSSLQAGSVISGQTTNNDSDSFGLAVSVSQSKVVVGAPNHTAVGDRAVFYYEAKNGWNGKTLSSYADTTDFEVESFTPTDIGAVAADKMGRAVTITKGNNVAMGAPLYASDDRGRVAFYFMRTPVAVDDFVVVSEDAGLTNINIRLNDIYGTETRTTVAIMPTLPPGTRGLLVWVPATATTDGYFTFNPNGEYEYLSANETVKIYVNYRLVDNFNDANGNGILDAGEYDFYSDAVVEITVQGQNDVPTVEEGIDAITIPHHNNGVPSSDYREIPISAFFDKDQSDTLSYSIVDIIEVLAPGAPALTGVAVPSTHPATGSIRVTGSYNKATGQNTGRLSYNMADLGEAYANTSWQVTVRVDDNQGGTRDTTFVFNIGRDNTSPVANPIPAQAAIEDVIFSLDLDPDNNSSTAHAFFDADAVSGMYPEALTYSLVSQSGPGPDWLSVSREGVLSGVASNPNVGVHTVVVRATDVFGNSVDSAAFTVTVSNTNDAPVLVNQIDRKVSIKGEAFSFNVNTGVVTWANPQPVDNTFGDAGPYFEDVDNYSGPLYDNRSPSAGDVVTYRAYNAVTGALLAGQAPVGSEVLDSANAINDTSWLSFNETQFSGTSAGTLGSIITVRLVATDNHGASTSTDFEIGIFPRDGVAAEPALPATPEFAGQLGYDVAINSGYSTTAGSQGIAGRWAVVGAPGADDGAGTANSGNGKIYIYENTAYATATAAPVWVLRHNFSTTVNYARLGAAVDISADGLRIVAGAPMENNGAGAVYYYQNTAGTWAAAGKGTAQDANAGDRFGSAVAINEDGGFVLAGAPLDDEAGTNAGAAYAFAWGAATASSDTAIAKILPTFDTGESGLKRAGDMFGSSVAFDENMFVIGSPGDDHSGKQDAGSAYVVSTDGAWSTSVATARFVKLTKSAAAVHNQDYFGTSVSVDSFDDRDSVIVAVGAPKDDRLAIDAGAVYVFRADDMAAENTVAGIKTAFEIKTVVTAYDGKALDEFGYSVSVDVDAGGGVDADGDENAGNSIRMAVGGALNASSTGAVYALRYWSTASVNGGWVGQRYLPAMPADPDENNGENKFGYAVDVGGSRFLVGAPDAERDGASSTPGFGTIALKAGKFYSFSSVLAASTPIEVMPTSSSAPITKTPGTDAPAPVVIGAGTSGGNAGKVVSPATPASGVSVDLLGLSERSGRWEALLRPVSDWSAATDTVWRRHQDDEWFKHSSTESYADALLFDERTRAAEKVAAAVMVSDDDAVQEEAPVKNGAEGADSPEKVDEAGASALLKGLSMQLELAQGARSRDAQRLLASLNTLAG